MNDCFNVKNRTAMPPRLRFGASVRINGRLRFRVVGPRRLAGELISRQRRPRAQSRIPYSRRSRSSPPANFWPAHILYARSQQPQNGGRPKTDLIRAPKPARPNPRLTTAGSHSPPANPEGSPTRRPHPPTSQTGRGAETGPIADKRTFLAWHKWSNRRVLSGNHLTRTTAREIRPSVC